MQYHENLTSTSIGAIAYDASRLLLVVGFKNGTVYEYQGVHGPLVAEWLNSSSLGSFYSRAVRGQFKSRRLEPHELDQFLHRAAVYAPVAGIDPGRRWLVTLLSSAHGTPDIVF
jgi:hypothetical protein